MKSIREIARTLGNVCAAVGADRHLWGTLKDKRVQATLSLCGNCDMYADALLEFCESITELPHSPTESELYAHTMSADWYRAWKWFCTHPDAVCLTNRAIEANATPEDLKQFNFRLSRFVRIAFQQELDVICQMTKDYILEVCREQ